MSAWEQTILLMQMSLPDLCVLSSLRLFIVLVETWPFEMDTRTPREDKKLAKKKKQKIFGGNNETAEKLSKIKTITNFTLVATIKKEKKTHKKPNFLYKDILHL